MKVLTEANLHFIRVTYSYILKRFLLHFRDPYIIKIEEVSPCIKTGKMMVSYHAANKRTEDKVPVDEFVNSSLIYFVDPRAIYLIGAQNGAFNERIAHAKQQKKSIKQVYLGFIKRIFIDNPDD